MTSSIDAKQLSGMSIPELSLYLGNLPGLEKLSRYRAEQIFSWIQKGARSFNVMTNLPQSLIHALEGQTNIYGSHVKKIQTDNDDTVKLAVELKDKTYIETVLLGSPSNKYTACLSTQAGCPMSCVFCKTGSIGFLRNLDASEIVEQFLFLKNCLAEKSAETKKELRISNLVIMGMGEPLLNLSALRKALEIICSKKGCNLSKRKITISTIGIFEGILDLAENGPEAELAVSITSAREPLRQQLTPGTIKYPLSKLKKALKIFQKKYKRQITIETVLLSGINTGETDAAALIDFAKDLDILVNLIPWNPVKDLSFEGKKLKEAGKKEIDFFSGMLEKGGLTVTQRFRRGRGINGACGQLGSTLTS